MKRELVIIDFETDGIEARPDYPPKPAGVSIQMPGQRVGEYFAWAHPEGNNSDVATVKRRLRDIVRSKAELVFHNAKFDLDVMETHLQIPLPSWDRVHDTMFLLFLDDPHSRSISLKPASERLLGMPPEERDAVRDWLVDHGIVKRNDTRWGAHIAKAPGNIVGKYAKGDTTRTKKLFDLLYKRVVDAGMLEAYNRERELMPILLQNEREGMRVDVDLLRADVLLYTQALERADDYLRKRLKAPGLNIDSDRELADVLDREGIVTDWVLTAKGQKSVAKKNMTPDMFNDKRIRTVLGYRNRLTTCLGTFMRPWLVVAEATGGRIHTNWNQVRQAHGNDNLAGARTGRMSTNPNFQNIPKVFYDKDDGYEHPKHLSTLPELPLIRRYVLPDDRHSLFLHRDYNQQELRILAHFEDGALMQAYNEDPTLDIHNFVQAKIAEVMRAAPLERRAVKIMNFGMIYGMGIGKLADSLHTDADAAAAIKNAHRKALPDVRDLERGIKENAKDDNPIRTWGDRLYYCEPPAVVKGRRMTFEYKLLNYLIQGSAADCTKQAVINYHHIKKEGRFLVTVHDEINISAPKKAHKAEMALLREAMESVKFDVPMISDGKTGPNWASLTSFKEPARARS